MHKHLGWKRDAGGRSRPRLAPHLALGTLQVVHTLAGGLDLALALRVLLGGSFQLGKRLVRALQLVLQASNALLWRGAEGRGWGRAAWQGRPGPCGCRAWAARQPRKVATR